jgi:nitroreductase
MNETIKNIIERRSIREYKTEQIKDSDLKLILEAGKYAPSAMNQQQWHFTVLQNVDLMRKISDLTKKAVPATGNERYMAIANMPNFSNFHNAPTAIIISCIENGKYATTDCANATQNMAVAAHSLGLASCYIASFTMALTGEQGSKIINSLDIPAGYKPIFALALGYRNGDNPEPAPRKENTVNYVR